MGLKKIECKGVNWIQLADDSPGKLSNVNMV